MSAQVIAIANCKGGTGKTTTAVNLAAELAHFGRRVLLVDLDAQGHAGFGFGVCASHETATAHQVFRRRDVDVAASIRHSAVPGVDVLPADPAFKIHGVTDDPRRLGQALARLGPRYDTVLIDTPPSADLPLVAALAAAHCVLVPSQLTHLAHHGLTQFSRLFFNVATEINPLLNAFAIVPVQMDMRMHLQQTILAKLLQDFGSERIFRGIRTDVSLAEAFGCGRPVRDYRPYARGALDYCLLAKDVRGFWAG